MYYILLLLLKYYYNTLLTINIINIHLLQFLIVWYLCCTECNYILEFDKIKISMTWNRWSFSIFVLLFVWYVFMQFNRNKLSSAFSTNITVYFYSFIHFLSSIIKCIWSKSWKWWRETLYGLCKVFRIDLVIETMFISEILTFQTSLNGCFLQNAECTLQAMLALALFVPHCNNYIKGIHTILQLLRFDNDHDYNASRRTKEIIPMLKI